MTESLKCLAKLSVAQECFHYADIYYDMIWIMIEYVNSEMRLETASLDDIGHLRLKKRVSQGRKEF